MENLFDSNFFVSVRQCIRASEIPTPEVIMEHYGDFAAALGEAVEKEESILSLFRLLRLVHIEISSSYKYIEDSGQINEPVLVMVLWKARERVEVELDIVYMKVEQYGLAPKSPDTVNDAPVFWSKEYTVTDLMELILSLHESGALVYRDGSKASLAALVRLFEHSFNISIKDPRGLKSNVTTRKIKATKFLDVLSANFIELCSH